MFSIIGEKLLNLLSSIKDFFSYTVEVFYQVICFPKQTNVSYMVLLRQILFTGYEALGLLLIISMAIGGLIIMELGPILENFGQKKLLYDLLIATITKELSCVLTAFVIIARSGTAISTELGNMKVNEEIDLIESIGISPISYLVVPRLVGVTVSCFVLSVYFNIGAFIGGWWFASFFNPIPYAVFMDNLLKSLQLVDIVQSIIKSILFGIIIALVSTYQGLNVKKAVTEVPQKTIRAVVLSLTFIILFDVLISLFFIIL